MAIWFERGGFGYRFPRSDVVQRLRTKVKFVLSHKNLKIDFSKSKKNQEAFFSRTNLYFTFLITKVKN